MLDLNSVVKNAHSSLSEEKRKEVLRFLENYGVHDKEDLKLVTVEELMENNLLQKAAAKRLFNYFQTGSETPSGSNRGTVINQSVGGNANNMTAVGRDQNQTNIRAGTMTSIGSAEDVQIGNQNPRFQTAFHGPVRSGVFHAGQGNVSQH